MLPANRDVVVTGLGAVCALAGDCPGLWQAVEVGRCGIAPIRRFPTDGFAVHTGATVPGSDEPEATDRRRVEQLCRRFANAAAGEAIAHARLDTADVPPERVGFAFGTGLGDLAHPLHTLAEHIADRLDLRGPRITVSTACSSSTGAIGLARDLVSMGAADVVVAGGADVLSPEVFAGFHALGVLNPGRCAPFSYPLGTTLGEGAGFVVLERGDLADRRSARPLARLSGYGLSGDAYHETSPDPKGTGVERMLRWALLDAGIAPGDVDYINVHGSGTEANDPSEWLGIQAALGTRAAAIPLSSTKGALGHAQGAAGVLEAIVTILAMQRRRVPPTLNFIGPRPHGPRDPVPGPLPRVWPCRHAVCLNSAFGGANAALVVSRSETPAPALRGRRPVHVMGVGLVGPYGLGTEAFLSAGRRGDRPHGRVPPFSIRDLAPRADPRGLDPASRFLTAAAALALTDARVTLTGSARDRAGLLAATLRPSPTSLAEFSSSIVERGLLGLSAPAFARIVLNAPAGFCSKLLSLRGPLTVVSTGAGSGLAAVAQAAELLSTRADLDFMLAASVDEHDAGVAPGDQPDAAEGAVCLALGSAGASEANTGSVPVRLAGWALAGPGRLRDAIAQATANAEWDAPVDRVFREEDWENGGTGGTTATGSGLACGAAVLALRRGELQCALVSSGRGRSACAAILLTR